MKLYIYQLIPSYDGGYCSLKEYICEARETEKTFTPKEKRIFPAVYLTRIPKEPLPVLYSDDVYISKRPLDDKSIIKIFSENREKAIKNLEAEIFKEKNRINQLSMMEVERDANP